MRCTRTLVVVAFVGTLLRPTSLLAQQPTMDGYPPEGAPPVITVTDSGAEPRVPLRFRVSPGQRTGMLMTMNMSETSQLGGVSQTARLPAVTVTGNVTVTGVSADGDISCSLGLTDVKVAAVGVDSGVLAAMRNAANLFSKVTMAATLSSRGVLREIRWDLHEVPDAQLREPMSARLALWTDSIVPWPEDAVGVGARWTVRRTAPNHGMSLFSATDYEIVSIDGSGVTVVAKTEGAAPIQVVTASNGTSGTISGALSGSWKTTVRLDSLVPASEGRVTAAMAINRRDLPDSLRMNSEVEFSIAPTTPVASPYPEPTPAGAVAGNPAQLVRIGGSIKLRIDAALTGWDTTAVEPEHMRVGAGVLTLLGDSGWLLTSDLCQNVSLRFEARALTPDTVAGVLFHALGASAYELRLCQGGHCGQLLQHGCVETRPVHLAIAIRPAKKWRRYAVDVNGTAILALVDGEPVVDKRDLDYRSGYVGFHADRGAIEVRKLKLDCARPPPPAPASIDAVRPGAGVSVPIPLRESKPEYTRRAMQEKVQGEVWLECVVLPDGTVGQVNVVRSLHPDLDAEAIAAAKRWRFRPGTRNGEPVAVLVTISMSFTLK